MRRREKALFTVLAFVLLVGCCVDFFDIAWGTGVWFGEMALSWAILLSVFCITCMVIFMVLTRMLWSDDIQAGMVQKLNALRGMPGWIRILLAVFLLVFPVWFLQFTVYGIVFQGLFLRLTLWMLELYLLGYLFTSKEDSLISVKVFLFFMILTAGIFAIFSSLRFVTDYPFSLGWSEGNRLWDYSILFGRERYDYPAGEKIPVFLEFGRQLVGAIPFLYSNLTIANARLWMGLASIVPYLFLGLVVFRSESGNKRIWLATALGTFLFLRQGPINPSLLLVAVGVALAWRMQLHYALPLLLLSTFYAALSRFTWLFAPAAWMVMLEFASASFMGGGVTGRVWKRSIWMGLAGVMGGILFPKIIAVLFPRLVAVAGSGGTVLGDINPGLVELIFQQLSDQPLLWYRLLPNSTYGYGIIIALLIAIFPLCVILYHLATQKIWQLNLLQRLSLILPLVAFLIVGLVVSVKIGGGGDLHNMDMFLIGLFFCGLIAWQNGGRQWWMGGPHISMSIKMLLVLLFAIPGIRPLQEMRYYNSGGAASWLVALTDVANEKSLELYPSDATITESLAVIQQEANFGRAYGDVLFVDQRQLLTFDFIQEVPLIPDYDKKVLIEKAMTRDRDYFQVFYQDLERARFSLIIVQPLNTPKKGGEYEFGEENNAWVKWVAKPLLCYYEIKQTLIEVNVQLLVPRMSRQDCVKDLP